MKIKKTSQRPTHTFVSLMFCLLKRCRGKVGLQNSFLLMLLEELEEGSWQFSSQYQAVKCFRKAPTRFHFCAPGEGNFPSDRTAHASGKEQMKEIIAAFHIIWVDGWGEQLQGGDYMENGLVKDMG